MKQPFYITTTIPYVNAPPHIGFALEVVQADAVARFMRRTGYDVVFNTGTDEHGAKIYEKAREERKDPQAYVDEYAAKFSRLKDVLNLSYTNFTRTTDPHHVHAAQEFWRRCDAKGDIYKKLYKLKYCIGCELEKTDSELANGRCPIHPNRELEIREEENYFFRFSNYQKPLLALYDVRPDFVVPGSRLREIRTFVEGGLQDFSISRLAAKMPWGVPVPNDPDHVMFVWFDALVNYISTLGWPEEGAEFNTFWPGIQFAGKDNLRQQSAMWQAMLMSANIPPSKQIVIHGFITSGGQKISKSLGNTVDPFEVVDRYGTDALRYWLLREMNPFEDGDFSMEKFAARYEGDLANGLGNYAARVLALGAKIGIFTNRELDPKIAEAVETAHQSVARSMEAFKFHEALAAIWQLIGFGDAYVNETKPWEGEKPHEVYNAIVILDNVAALLVPFLPSAAEAITKTIAWQSPEKLSVKKIDILFPRIETNGKK